MLMLLPPCTTAAAAEISFARLAQMVAAPDELRGSFHQQKYLGELDVSLDSSGNFSFRRGESIRWHIVEPIDNELLITPDGLSSRQGSNELLHIDAGSNPAVVVVGEIMFALLSAQWQRLEQYFELSGDIDGQQWHAVLQPRTAVVSQFIQRVELRGAQWLQVIVLHENGGDKTTIRLDITGQ
jgi:hypothetical protein